MKQEILFTLKVQGVFRQEGFIPDETAPVSTITKFKDGTWTLKIGRMTLKDRFSTGHEFISKSLKIALNIQL
jgi:hypothetical protein